MELQSSKHHGNRKHGGFGTRLYRIWIGMKDRCFNKNGSNYYAYGAKGIIVVMNGKIHLKHLEVGLQKMVMKILLHQTEKIMIKGIILIIVDGLHQKNNY